MFKIRFDYLPSSWGLKGKTRDIAQAEYELTGPELEFRLLEINKDDLEEDVYIRRKANLEFKYNLIDEEELHRRLAKLIKDPIQSRQALLEIDFRAGKISENEYNKSIASCKNEAWVCVVNMDFTKGGVLEGNFELDWNEAFVERLKANGYKGQTSDAIVNTWFVELCRTVALEEFDGTGTFTEDSEEVLNNLKE